MTDTKVWDGETGMTYFKKKSEKSSFSTIILSLIVIVFLTIGIFREAGIMTAFSFILIIILLLVSVLYITPVILKAANETEELNKTLKQVNQEGKKSL